MGLKPAICLTFDLEEFDLPLEYKQDITVAEQLHVSTEGLHALLPLLANAECTFFTTGFYAEKNPAVIKELAVRHEIASHAFFHSAFVREDMQKSKLTLESISGQKVTGFRMPRMEEVDHEALAAAGYRYDSSINPTYIPGRYNHFDKPKIIHRKNELIIFPASVTPRARTPLFWLTFKNTNIKWYCRQVEKCLAAYGYANLYFHPWEFADLSRFDIPSYIKGSPGRMKEKLSYLVSHFKEADFISIKQLLEKNYEL